MGKKIVLGGIVAGIVVFIWGAVSHMVLGLGEAGIKSLPNEEAILPVLSANITEPGFYFFPGIDMRTSSKEQMDVWTEKHRTGPAGIMIYQPIGGEPMPANKFIIELVTNILAALVAAFLLSKAVGNLGGVIGKAVFVALFGLFAGLDIDLSHWNWYEFPTTYTLAYMVDHVIAWFLAGLVLAWFFKKPAASQPAM
ncbi:MAG: hypothetical protein L0209_08465 [candidate division Zixibacteria bacterium]|nr:hypothetical protein [candidate division Zixibacteria bacterium]